MYKYTHDQSVNLMNKGYTGEEISETIKLPPELDKFWPNRGYYGTLEPQLAGGLSALHGLVQRQPVEPRTTCHRKRLPRSTSSTWVARPRS